MRPIFVSYRRDDTEGQAGRLFEALVAHFGKDLVFMDVADIELGRDFRKAIDENVASCGILLAVIGRGWLDCKDENGCRRLDDPLDFVRLETASALKRDIPVIPILVQNANMPRAEQLPEDLKALAYRNGFLLTHAHWNSDLEHLIDKLEQLPESGKAKQQPRASKGKYASFFGIAVIIALIVLASVIRMWRINVKKPLEVKSARAEVAAEGLHAGGDVSSIAFDPARKLLVAGTYGNLVDLWDLTKASPTPLIEPRFAAAIQSVAIGPRLLSAGGYDRKIYLYRLTEKLEVLEPYQATLDADGVVNAVAFNSETNLLVSGSSSGTVTLWRESEGKWLAGQLYKHKAAVNSVAFSPNGTLLASGSDDRTIRLWDLVSNSEITSPKAPYFGRHHNNKVAGLAFSPNGSELASAGWDNSVRIWQVSTKQELRSLPHSAAVYAVAFSPDGHWLASGGDDNTVTVWDTSSWSPRIIGSHDKRITAVSFGPDEPHWLASASIDRTIRFWHPPQ